MSLVVRKGIGAMCWETQGMDLNGGAESHASHLRPSIRFHRTLFHGNWLPKGSSGTRDYLGWEGY